MTRSLAAVDGGSVSKRTVRAYIGLGANLGDAEQTLAAAVGALAASSGIRIRGVSRLYATAPVGLEEQPEFRNAVVAIDWRTGPDPTTAALALLARLKSIERAFGRQPRGRWGPRELDLDLLVFGRVQLSVERPAAARSVDAEVDPAKAMTRLTVPHPAAEARLFVLAPLADLAPGLAPPGWGSTVEAARRRRVRVEGSEAVRAVGRWDPETGGWRPLGPG
jgi:2-amino-4-hydroxy-6-hydroxymethyldihydropteridine diphosphokinase